SGYTSGRRAAATRPTTPNAVALQAAAGSPNTSSTQSPSGRNSASGIPTASPMRDVARPSRPGGASSATRADPATGIMPDPARRTRLVARTANGPSNTASSPDGSPSRELPMASTHR